MGQNLLMTTSHVCKMNAIYFMYITIQFFVSMYNDTISKKNYFINKLNERDEYILLTEPY